MGTAKVTLTPNAFPNGSSFAQYQQTIRGKAVISGSSDTYAQGGLAVSFSGSGWDVLQSAQDPVQVRFFSDQVSGFVYAYDAKHKKLVVLVSASSGYQLIELADGSGTVASGIAGDDILFEAVFPSRV